MSFHALVDEKGVVVGVSHDGHGTLALLPGHKLVAADVRPWPGMIYVDGAFKTPPQPPPSVDELKAYAAAVRYANETGGILVDGVQVATDHTSQTRLGLLLRHIEAGDAGPCDFKAASGWIKLDSKAVQAIAKAIALHAQACFAAERKVALAIDDGKIKSFSEIDSAAWPHNS